MLPFKLTDVLEALGKLAVTLEQHPRGATSLIVLAALLGLPLTIWLFKQY